MRRHDPATCSDDCPACEDLAEARAEAAYDDDPGGQDQYERHLDRMGGDL